MPSLIVFGFGEGTDCRARNLSWLLEGAPLYSKAPTSRAEDVYESTESTMVQKCTISVEVTAHSSRGEGRCLIGTIYPSFSTFAPGTKDGTQARHYSNTVGGDQIGARTVGATGGWCHHHTVLQPISQATSGIQLPFVFQGFGFVFTPLIQMRCRLVQVIGAPCVATAQLLNV